MSDLLLDNEQARKLIKTLGLPLPVPERLRRAKGPYEERPLEGKVVLVGGHSALRDTLASSLAKMGAESVVFGDEDDAKPFRRAGEAWGRPVRVVPPGEAPEDVKVDAIVYDATGVRGPDDLKGLYEFFMPYMRRLKKGGRCVVIGRPAALAGTHSEAAAAAGLEGFTRSLGKEVGEGGSTANSVFVEKGAEGRLDATLRFLLLRDLPAVQHQQRREGQRGPHHAAPRGQDRAAHRRRARHRRVHGAHHGGRGRPRGVPRPAA